MVEACVLFVHHKDDEITRLHLDRVRQLTRYPIIPLKGEDGGVRPHSAEHPWRSSDALVYSWFLRRGFDAERYVVLEWDCLLTMPVKDYYSEVWNSHAAASVVTSVETHPCWHWFREVSKLPEDLRKYACGMVPLNGTLLSHAALLAITSEPIPQGVFGELRIGTLLRSRGIDPIEVPTCKGKTNSWSAYLTEYEPTRPGLYHPVKSLNPKAAVLAKIPIQDKSLQSAKILSQLAVGDEFIPKDFSEDAAYRAMSHAGWTISESSEAICFLRDNGIISQQRVGSSSRLRFRLDSVAEKLAALAYIEANEQDSGFWSDVRESAKSERFQKILQVVRETRQQLKW